MLLRFIKWYTHSQKRIKVSNFINRQISNIVNNRFSNWLKEIFNIGLDYPLYLYCDEAGEFLYKFNKEYQQKNWLKRLFGNRLIDATLTLTNIPSQGMDFRKMFSFQRKKIKNDVNNFFANDDIRNFRFKSIVTIESKMKTGETDILP